MIFQVRKFSYNFLLKCRLLHVVTLYDVEIGIQFWLLKNAIFLLRGQDNWIKRTKLRKNE